MRSRLPNPWSWRAAELGPHCGLNQQLFRPPHPPLPGICPVNDVQSGVLRCPVYPSRADPFRNASTSYTSQSPAAAQPCSAFTAHYTEQASGFPGAQGGQLEASPTHPQQQVSTWGSGWSLLHSGLIPSFSRYLLSICRCIQIQVAGPELKPAQGSRCIGAWRACSLTRSLTLSFRSIQPQGFPPDTCDKIRSLKEWRVCGGWCEGWMETCDAGFCFFLIEV